MLRLIAILVFLSGTLAFGQDPAHDQTKHAEEHSSGHEEHSAFRPHRLALVSGYGFLSGAINEDGEKKSHIVPVFGVDYEYWFNHKIGVGTHNDLEMGVYSVELDHQEYIERNFAVVTSLVFLYEPVHNWALFAGPGYELEKHHNFPVFKVGTDISKSFEGGWGIGVVLAYDFKEVNSAITLGFTVSKRLGKH
ncbi:MAG: hypothetical protein ABFS28_01400 [Bacteroidota bacterium]